MRRNQWIWLGFIAIAAFFLLSEHRAHAFGFLPYLLLLACPLMHLMHGGHGGHGGHEGHGRHGNQDDRDQRADDTPVESRRPAEGKDHSHHHSDVGSPPRQS